MRIIKADKQYKVPQIDLLTFLFGKYHDSGIVRGSMRV
jgi:hypothetical protein